MTTEKTIATVTKTEQPDFVKRIGKTTYKVNVHFSATSKETMSNHERQDYPYAQKRGQSNEKLITSIVPILFQVTVCHPFSHLQVPVRYE